MCPKCKSKHSLIRIADRYGTYYSCFICGGCVDIVVGQRYLAIPHRKEVCLK